MPVIWAIYMVVAIMLMLLRMAIMITYFLIWLFILLPIRLIQGRA